MLRLSTICLLLAVAVAQNGYEYNKPGKPFGQNTSIRPSGYPSSTPSYTSGSQDNYPGIGGGTTPYPSGQSTGANYQGPLGPSGYPEQPSSNYPRPNYPGQGPTGSSGPSGYPGQAGSNYPGQNYPGQTSRPSTPGFGQGVPGSLPETPGFIPGNSNYGPGAAGFGPVGSGFDSGAYEGGDYSAIPGEPDKDYPILSYVPETSFRCDAQLYPGYYADVETRCQAFHVCANNITYDFLCPNGTIFSQEVFVCVWWNQFDCNSAPSLYELNANLYDYSIIGSQQQVSYPGNQGSYPGNQGSFPGNQGPQDSYPGSQVPSYPSSPSPLGPSYPGTSTPYPNDFGSQGPSSGYPSSSYPQGTTPSYPGTQDATTYPGTRPNIRPGQQAPSSYPGSSNYPSTGPQNNYPSSQGNYPGSQSTTGYPGSQSSPNQGYPSGRPSGPSFPTGTTRPQGSSTGYPQPPNREYLPPRN